MQIFSESRIETAQKVVFVYGFDKTDGNQVGDQGVKYLSKMQSKMTEFCLSNNCITQMITQSHKKGVIFLPNSTILL